MKKNLGIIFWYYIEAVEKKEKKRRTEKANYHVELTTGESSDSYERALKKFKSLANVS